MPPTVPDGPHTPITNVTEAAAAIAPAATPPFVGEFDAQVTPNAGGVESVERPEVFEAMADQWIAPDTSKLADVGAASFGALPEDVLETLHGPDDRVRITKTAMFPWRVHASLLITAADGSAWIGTAWFIGPHTLATAAHCVYIKNNSVQSRNGWVKSILVMPGRDGAKLPFGSVTADRFFTVKGWADTGDQNYDYGAIVIPTDLGQQVGWFGIGVYPDAELTASVGNVSGYPGDKPEGTQWYDTHQIASVTPSKVYYDIDTVGGQSGSAVYRIIDGKQVGVAIHAYGGATHNSGTRISTPVHANLTAWSK
jgi:V8-like Glu-specific endopeptidase